MWWDAIGGKVAKTRSNSSCCRSGASARPLVFPPVPRLSSDRYHPRAQSGGPRWGAAPNGKGPDDHWSSSADKPILPGRHARIEEDHPCVFAKRMAVELRSRRGRRRSFQRPK